MSKEVLKAIGDVSAAGITVATVFQWLPAIAAVFAIVWYGMNFYEKITGRPFSESSSARWLRGAK